VHRKFASKMNKRPELSEKWIKASIIGTIWAASEIVLGSFLHNLRIPFSSNVLTAIGIIILISTSYKWTEKGLFWRSGLICALMKTMSPSAVIFGPMLAIFGEAVLLEISTRILGRNFIGFAIGAMVAMTSNLFHKIVNYIIFYGFNIVNVYSDLLHYAQKQLNINVDLVWSPLIVLTIIYCLLGLVAAIIGIKVGRKLLSQTSEFKLPYGKSNFSPLNNNRQSFGYSVLWLFVDIILIITAFVLLNFTSLIVWSLSISAIVVIWVLRYKRALRQLSRPRFWVLFVIITMITAFVFSRIQSQDLVNGLLIGVQMNFRAVIVILGFSVLGTELYNPKVRAFFLKTSFKQLPLALELSFESLPLMIAAVPEFKAIIKNPVLIIYQILSQIEYRLNEAQNKLQKRVFIITGPIGQGKTTQIQQIIETLKENNIPVSGIFSPRITEKGITTGYDIVNIETGRREAFLRKTDCEVLNGIGKYNIIQSGLESGIDALSESLKNNSRLIVIDEIGKLELEDRGWSGCVTELVKSSAILIFSVRDTFTDKVIKKWGLNEYSVFNVADDPYLTVCNLITTQIVK
jgi:nucleoside-triphosphatase THEP1